MLESHSFPLLHSLLSTLVASHFYSCLIWRKWCVLSYNYPWWWRWRWRWRCRGPSIPWWRSSPCVNLVGSDFAIVACNEGACPSALHPISILVAVLLASLLADLSLSVSRHQVRTYGRGIILAQSSIKRFYSLSIRPSMSIWTWKWNEAFHGYLIAKATGRVNQFR